MAVFAYKALDTDQSVVAGTLLADSPRQARDSLRGRGLVVQEVAVARLNGRQHAAARLLPWNWSSSLAAKKTIGGGTRSQGQIVAFVRELSTLLGVGIPLLEAIDTIIKQHKGRFRLVLQQLRDQVAAGVSLAEAMAQQPAVFDDFCLNLVEVGENAGNLDVALTRLAEFKERSAQFRGKITNALLYPAIVFCMAIAVSIFLMTYVTPKLLSGLIEAGRPIPLATRIVKGFSDLLLSKGWLIAIVVVLVAAILGWLWRTPGGRLRFHRLQLRTPLLGDLIRKQAISRIAMVMAALMRSGIVFVRAIQITQRTTANLVIREALARCEAAVHAGQDIAQALEDTGAFPPTVVQVFAVGEQSGRLEEMLDRLALDYDHQVNTATGRLTTVLEPLLIIFLVLMVGLIAFATVLPMLEAGNVL